MARSHLQVKYPAPATRAINGTAKATNSTGQANRSSERTASGLGSATVAPVVGSVAVDPDSAEKTARTPNAADAAMTVGRRQPFA